jgi:hypothetical protein
MAEKLRSSEYWYSQVTDFTIQTPKGWDMDNFDRSWNELITKEEFDKRVSESVIVVRR